MSELNTTDWLGIVIVGKVTLTTLPGIGIDFAGTLIGIFVSRVDPLIFIDTTSLIAGTVTTVEAKVTLAEGGVNDVPGTVNLKPGSGVLMNACHSAQAAFWSVVAEGKLHSPGTAYRFTILSHWLRVGSRSTN